MKTSRLWVLLLSIGACAPIQQTQSVSAEEGFITKDIYQTACSWTITEPELSDQLVVACRRKTVSQWASLKRSYDAGLLKNRDSFSLERLKKLKELKPKKTTYTPDQVSYLLEFYDDLLPGFLIYESREDGKWSGIYRVRKQNLLGTILLRDPWKNQENENRDKTIFK